MKFSLSLFYHKNDLQKTKFILELGLLSEIKEVSDMAVPKKKKSAAKSKQQRAHNALSAMESMKCPKCGEKKRPHHVCAACGAYGDLSVNA